MRNALSRTPSSLSRATQGKPAPSIQYPVARTQHPASSIQYLVSSVQHPASSIQYLVSSIQNLASSICRVVAFLLLLSVFATNARADLAFPTSFEIVEESPSEFRLTLTVPMIKGKYLKAKAVVPPEFRPDKYPEPRIGTGSLTREWKIEADPASLPGLVFGMEGLRGTAQEARFVLRTLDGRRYETVLRPTRTFFAVPEPPALGQMAAVSGRQGIRTAARNLGLWVSLTCVLLAVRQSLRRTCLTSIICLLPILYWAFTLAQPKTGYSDSEVILMRGLFVAGCAVGVTCVGLAVRLACSLLGEGARSKVLGLAAVLLSAWLFYQAAGLLYNFGAIWLAGALGIKQELVNLWFAPFAADWAMAMLRIPLMTIAALAAMAVALVKIKHTQIRFAVSGCMLVVALVLLPYGVARASVPFLEPDPPSAKQARPIVEPMLSEIYHALNLEDENSTYDKLAEQVSSDLVTDLYLDSRRRLVSGTRKGATIEVKQVQLEDIGLSEASGKNGHSYLCRWTVRAKVSHWQHIHERRNVYEGDLELVVEDSNWKLGGLNLRSEEREVVPGSFRSR